MQECHSKPSLEGEEKVQSTNLRGFLAHSFSQTKLEKPKEL